MRDLGRQPADAEIVFIGKRVAEVVHAAHKRDPIAVGRGPLQVRILSRLPMQMNAQADAQGKGLETDIELGALRR